MTCQEVDQRTAELFDKEPTFETDLIREHLSGCPDCSAHFEEDQQIFKQMRQSRVTASPHFATRTMQALAHAAAEEALPTRNFWHLHGWRGWTVAGCAAALLILLLPTLPLHLGKGHSATAFTVLAQSIDAMSDVQTIHMTGRMRTLPGDNFELIGTKYAFVPLEMWRQYNPSRWRVGKPGRTVVMDSQSSILYISQLNGYMKASPQAGFVEWLRPLLNPVTILQKELDAAKQTPSQATVTQANGIITLTVRRNAQGSFTNSWAKNKSIDESDHICIYKFDSANRRLLSLQVMVRSGSEEVSVLELNDIRYNEALPDSLFAFQIPPGAAEIPSVEEMAPATTSVAGPKAAAEYFFDGLAREDWNEVRDVFPINPLLLALMKTRYGGLSTLSIGEPFRSGTYPGYFVPYRVRLRDGTEKAFNLAVRNDNSQHRWMIDGGF